MTPQLSGILGKVYEAVVMHQGDIQVVKDRFHALMISSPAFASEARDRLTALVELEQKVGADRMQLRDTIGAVHLEFLREALRNV